jgi:single-strand DNA-binding protein
VKKYTTEIVLQQYRGELTLLGGREGGGGGARSGPMDGDNYDYGEPGPAAAPAGGGRSAPARSKPADFDDDIPF